MKGEVTFMAINSIINELKNAFYKILGREISITSIIPNEDGYDIEFEVIQEDEYMKKRGRKDILAIYDVKADKDCKIISYSRRELKERGSLD